MNIEAQSRLLVAANPPDILDTLKSVSIAKAFYRTAMKTPVEVVINGEATKIYATVGEFSKDNGIVFMQFTKAEFSSVFGKLFKLSRKKDAVLEVMPIADRKGLLSYVYVE